MRSSKLAFFKKFFAKFSKWCALQKIKNQKNAELERSGKLKKYNLLAPEEKKLANELYYYYDELLEDEFEV